MKTVLVHVGGVKTGSTAFQAIGVSEGAALRASGFFYPATILEKEAWQVAEASGGEYFASGNGEWLAEAIRQRRDAGSKDAADLVGRLRDLLEQGGECDVAVLSSENFSWLSLDELRLLERIIRLATGAEARVVAVISLRTLFEHGLSWWAHCVRRDGLRTRRVPFMVSEYNNDQGACLERLLEVFGRANICAVTYREARALWELLASKITGRGLRLGSDRAAFRGNAALPLGALEALQGVMDALPEGSWEYAASGERYPRVLWRIADLLSGLSGPAPRRDVYRLPRSALAEVEAALTMRFGGEVQAINDKLTIEGGPWRLVPWEEGKNDGWIGEVTEAAETCARA